MNSATVSFDWMLHVPLIFRILKDLKYLEHRGVNFQLDGFVINRTGGWGYSPSQIKDFEQALTVLRDNGAACTPHFSAICLLEGVSHHRVLDTGRKLLNRLEQDV